jgi:hypothetical protein
MNNLMSLIGMLRSAGNPMAMLQQQAGNDPVIARALQMIQGKSPDQIMGIANNLAREQGVDINQFRSQLGL